MTGIELGVMERPEKVGGGSNGGGVTGTFGLSKRWILVPVRTNTGVPVFEGGFGGDGELIIGCEM